MAANLNEPWDYLIRGMGFQPIHPRPASTLRLFAETSQKEFAELRFEERRSAALLVGAIGKEGKTGVPPVCGRVAIDQR